MIEAELVHECNNLLQAIRARLGSAVHESSTNTESRPPSRQLQPACDRATAIAHRLLASSRGIPAERRTADANRLIEDFADWVRPVLGQGIALDVALGSRTGSFTADLEGFQQVLLNLCINARDAMPGGGSLLIKTERMVFNEPCRKLGLELPAGAYVVFSVSDTGCGIPHEIQGRVFAPYFTTKPAGKGSGLGLALARAFVEQHQGAIDLASEPGLGATFTIYLPSANSAARNLKLEPSGAVPHGGRRLLVVEDDDLIRDFAVRTLERAGFEVLAAADADEAMRLLDSARQTVSLAILDMALPTGSGLDVERFIERVSPGTKIVYCTGYDLKTAPAAGNITTSAPTIVKPFTATELLLFVGQLTSS